MSNSTFNLDEQPPSINLNDIQNLLLIVDLASQRGAFRAHELSNIGSTFDKVHKFLQAVTPSSTQENNKSEQGQQLPQSINPPFSPKIGA